jgi:hypothetical protein
MQVIQQIAISATAILQEMGVLIVWLNEGFL